MWQIVSSFSTRHAGLVSNEKCFMPLTRRFPSERDHLFLMSFACEKAEDECSQWPRLANFMAESQHPLLMLVNSCPDFFLKKKHWVSHSFLLGNQAICTWIELSITASAAHHHPSVAYPCQTYRAIACGSQNRIQCWSRCLKAEAVAEKRRIGS